MAHQPLIPIDVWVEINGYNPLELRDIDYDDVPRGTIERMINADRFVTIVNDYGELCIVPGWSQLLCEHRAILPVPAKLVPGYTV